MSTNQHNSAVIPGFRYDDAAQAIEWLCRVFGFQKHAVYPNPDGTIAHAELTFNGGMIMLGSAANHSPLSPYMLLPREVSHRSTVSAYVVTGDPETLYAQVVGAGAEIVLPLEDKGYGGKGFDCRDLEGYLWSFGSYDPWSLEKGA